MSTYTEHYKLIKPSYDEDIDVQDINNNMDAIDNTINGLDFVQNAFIDSNGLHLNKRDGSIIDVPLDYLKLTGGNVTGNITVKNCPVIYIVDTVTTTTQTSIKYSDGTLIQYGTIDNPSTTNFKIPFTFQTPFINNKYIVFTANDGDRLYPDGKTYNTSFDHPCWVYRMNKTTTSCMVAGDDYAQGFNILAIGHWK